MITTIDQLKAAIPTIAGDNFDIYQGAVNRAYRWIARDVLGESVVTMTDEILAQKIDSAVAYRAYGEAIPMLDLINDGNNFVVINNENHSPASRERVTALVASMDRALSDALTDIYEYVEDNEALAAKFASFVGSTIVEGSFLLTLRQFRLYGTFTGGYAEWILTRPKHQRIISLQLKPRFTEPLIRAVVVDPSAARFTEIIDPLRYAFAALMTDDLKTAQAMMTEIDNELMAHPEKYPEYASIAPKRFESTSTISFL